MSRVTGAVEGRVFLALVLLPLPPDTTVLLLLYTAGAPAVALERVTSFWFKLLPLVVRGLLGVSLLFPISRGP